MIGKDCTSYRETRLVTVGRSEEWAGRVHPFRSVWSGSRSHLSLLPFPENVPFPSFHPETLTLNGHLSEKLLLRETSDSSTVVASILKASLWNCGYYSFP